LIDNNYICEETEPTFKCNYTLCENCFVNVETKAVIRDKINLLELSKMECKDTPLISFEKPTQISVFLDKLRAYIQSFDPIPIYERIKQDEIRPNLPQTTFGLSQPVVQSRFGFAPQVALPQPQVALPQPQVAPPPPQALVDQNQVAPPPPQVVLPQPQALVDQNQVVLLQPQVAPPPPQVALPQPQVPADQNQVPDLNVAFQPPQVRKQKNKQTIQEYLQRVFKSTSLKSNTQRQNDQRVKLQNIKREIKLEKTKIKEQIEEKEKTLFKKFETFSKSQNRNKKNNYVELMDTLDKLNKELASKTETERDKMQKGYKRKIENLDKNIAKLNKTKAELLKKFDNEQRIIQEIIDLKSHLTEPQAQPQIQTHPTEPQAQPQIQTHPTEPQAQPQQSIQENKIQYILQLNKEINEFRKKLTTSQNKRNKTSGDKTNLLQIPAIISLKESVRNNIYNELTPESIQSLRELNDQKMQQREQEIKDRELQKVSTQEDEIQRMIT
jgi:hypothetical protein